MMHVEIEGLLALQGHDQGITAIETELARIPTEETSLDQKLAAQSARFEQLKNSTRQLDTERKKLDLEGQSKQALIPKYKTQQRQTRKKEKIAALNHENPRAEGNITAINEKEHELIILPE